MLYWSKATKHNVIWVVCFIWTFIVVSTSIYVTIGRSADLHIGVECIWSNVFRDFVSSFSTYTQFCRMTPIWIGLSKALWIRYMAAFSRHIMTFLLWWEIVQKYGKIPLAIVYIQVLNRLLLLAYCSKKYHHLAIWQCFLRLWPHKL